MIGIGLDLILMHDVARDLNLVLARERLEGDLTLGTEEGSHPVVTLSAKSGQGLVILKQHLKQAMGYSDGEGHFAARRRHLDALERARSLLVKGKSQLEMENAAELLADDLFHAQQALGEITGEFRADDLLGYIFSSFCIGK